MRELAQLSLACSTKLGLNFIKDASEQDKPIGFDILHHVYKYVLYRRCIKQC